MKAKNFLRVFPRICQGWSIIRNYQFHVGGQIWLIWQPSVFVVNVCKCAAQFIHYEVVHRDYGMTFEVIMVYGANDATVRNDLWIALEQISYRVKVVWISFGDFNNVLNLAEIIGYAVLLEEVAQFRQCIRDCQVNDHPTKGPFFTWSNKQEGENTVFSKIGKVLANS